MTTATSFMDQRKVAGEERRAMETTSAPLRVGYVVRSYPRLSQTFILNEVLALEERGVQVRIFSSTNPQEAIVQKQVDAVRAQVDYLDVARGRPWWMIVWEHMLMALLAPLRYFPTLWYVVAHPEFDEGYTASGRADCFFQAVYLSHLLRRARGGPGEIDHLHAHFAHDPTLIAQLTHRLTGIGFTFTAHARDIYQIPGPALADRIEQSSGVVTCCAVNVDYFESVVTAAHHAKLRVIHNGINLRDFLPSEERGEPSAAPLILSASRLVEKKGYFDLLTACQRLMDQGQSFRCVIVGDGPLRAELEAQILERGLAAHVTLPGACTQQELREMMPQATLFALTPFVTEDGDRDGVPTVLAEAMACGIPVVSTTVAGIPELVNHEENGLLAAPHDVDAITANLISLLNDGLRRQAYGAAARDTIYEHFNLQNSALELANLYRTATGA